jgi:hypothetical protein
VKNKFLVNSLLFLMIGGVSSVAWGMKLNDDNNQLSLLQDENNKLKGDINLIFGKSVNEKCDYTPENIIYISKLVSAGQHILKVYGNGNSIIIKEFESKIKDADNDDSDSDDDSGDEQKQVRNKIKPTSAYSQALDEAENFRSFMNVLKDVKFFEQSGATFCLDINNYRDSGKKLKEHALLCQKIYEKNEQIDKNIRTIFSLDKNAKITEYYKGEVVRCGKMGYQLYEAAKQNQCANLLAKFHLGELTNEQVKELIFEDIPALVKIEKQGEREAETNVFTKFFVKHERKCSLGAILALIACLIYQNYGNDIQNILSGMSPSQSV